MLKTCAKGHQFFKSSDCPTCPVCEADRSSANSFLSRFGAPARRALEGKGIHSPEDLSKFSEAEILSLHGMGKASLPVLKKVLKDKGLRFRIK